MSYFNKPTDEQIRERAYEIYLQRGSAPGQEVEDWLAAEQELGSADLQSEDLRTAKKRTASA